jgi:hypothetical protein
MLRAISKFFWDAESCSENNLKVGSVTNTLDAGEPLENVKVIGEWKSVITPLHNC